MTSILFLLLQGWLVGFSIALPVGPIAMLCIRHSLIRGALYGIIAGLGAAVADTVYGLLGGLGATLICEFVTAYRMPCQIVSALLLCYIGIAILRSPNKEKKEEEIEPSNYFKVFFSTFLLTLTNPLTLLGFIGIYTALGLGIDEERLIPFLIVNGGIFLGSMCCWLILSATAGLIGKKTNFKSTKILNRISGAVFLGCGLLVGITAFH